jgi:ankyrin repeat protein
VRMKFARSGLFYELASESGSTRLQYAVCRGDLEIVELLLEHGAETSTKNDLGRDVLSYVQSRT